MDGSFYRIVDLALFVIANLVNLTVVTIFLSRSREWDRIEYILGLVVVAMILPVGTALILNILGKREWWTIVYPMLLVLFCIVELILDYILKLEFRKTALLWPYIALFYLATIGMVGYAFAIGKKYGFVTLFTYFLNLAATWYAHSR